MSEKITLDPSQVATSRTELDITDWIAAEGADWGDAEISAFLAEQQRGEVPVDFRVPNRTVEIPMVLVARGGTTAVTARQKIQQKFALLQSEGGWLKRITAAGGTVYADVVGATFNATSVSGVESTQQVEFEAHATLELIPDFYGDETTLGDHTETTNPELVFTETSIAGDYPGRVRVVVDEDQGQDQRGLIWAFRSKNYDSASTAALKYEAEALGPLDTAAKAALSGASGGTVVTHGTLSTNWTPVLSTNIAGTQFMTHQGTYRLWIRYYTTSGTTVQVRGVYDVGDLVNPVELDSFRVPGASNFYVKDLGEVRLDKDAIPSSTHRWGGQIQAKGDVGGENFSVDRVWLVPVDEGMSVLTAPLLTTIGAATYSARSEFNTESGVITGDSLAVGGTWTGAGDADDFSVAGGLATRTAVSDTATHSGFGRLITASTPTLGVTFVQVDFASSALGLGSLVLFQGVLLRYVDSSNYVWAAYAQNLQKVRLFSRTGGPGDTILGESQSLPVTANAYYTLRVYADAAGRMAVWFGQAGANPSAPCITYGGSSTYATGGALDDGKVGVIDWHTDATAATRTYDNFAAWVPTPDAVNFASRSAQLTTQGHYRLDSGGTAYGPVSTVQGDLPRLPQASLEARTTEVFVKQSRGDFDQLPDSGIDDVSARVTYRPSYLFVP